MVAVKSTMQALGSKAADFSLPNIAANNELVSLSEQGSKPLLVMFICNHCPYVIHIMKRLVEIGNAAAESGFAVMAISSNDAQNYPQDGPAAMAKFAADYGFRFPYLYDESQSVAKLYGAACTPDFYVYDANHTLQYRGQMDAARPGSSAPVTGQELSVALESVLKGEPAQENQVPSIGCNIKWRAGNEPDYF